MMHVPILAAKECQVFYEYWQGLRADAPLPLRSQLRPADIKELLPFMTVVEHIPERQSAKFRLLGTAVEERFGKNFAGQELQINDEFQSSNAMSHMLANVFSFPCGCRVVVEEEYLTTRKGVVESINLPFAGPDGQARFSVAVSKQISEYIRDFTEERGLEGQNIFEYDFMDIGFGVPDKDELPEAIRAVSF